MCMSRVAKGAACHIATFPLQHLLPGSMQGVVFPAMEQALHSEGTRGQCFSPCRSDAGLEQCQCDHQIALKACEISENCLLYTAICTSGENRYWQLLLLYCCLDR